MCLRPGCGEVLEGLTGTFNSPNYPSDYTNNLDCQWTISVPSGAIQIDFTDFSLEASASCADDKLVVRSLFNMAARVVRSASICNVLVVLDTRKN